MKKIRKTKKIKNLQNNNELKSNKYQYMLILLKTNNRKTVIN